MAVCWSPLNAGFFSSLFSCNSYEYDFFFSSSSSSFSSSSFHYIAIVCYKLFNKFPSKEIVVNSEFFIHVISFPFNLTSLILVTLSVYVRAWCIFYIYQKKKNQDVVLSIQGPHFNIDFAIYYVYLSIFFFYFYEFL